MNDPKSTSRNPFPGLRPFENRDADLFFGREAQTDDLLARLRRQRFVAVVGTSGSGKSSLVRAGLLPALYGGFMVGAGSRWRVAIMRPGNAPGVNLAKALEECGALGSKAGDSQLRVELASSILERGARGLVELVRHGGLQGDENLLIVVDQFEELFRYRSEAAPKFVSDEGVAFVKLLLAAAKEPDLSAYVVITTRSDFLGHCAQFRDLPEAVNDGLFLVPRMSWDQLKHAIQGPVFVEGGRIAPRLVANLLNDLGDDPDQLPVLQHALMRTWQTWEKDHAADEPMDLRHYDATGGMEKALSRHADSVYDALPSDRNREVAEKLFKCLTDAGPDNLGIRRPTRFADACEITHASPQELKVVVEAFRAEGCSFLMPPPGTDIGPETVLDISHESLMRIWDKLRRWITEEARSAQIYLRLADAAALNAQRRAGLWTDAGLLALVKAWRDEQQPNAAWAARLAPTGDASIDGSPYVKAMRFLDRSEQDQAATVETARLRQEDEQRRDLEDQRRKIEFEEAAKRQRLEAQTQIERTRAESAHRLTARTRMFAMVLAAFALLAFVFGIFGLNRFSAAQTKADENVRLAERNSLRAERLTKVAHVQMAVANRQRQELRKIAELREAEALKQRQIAKLQRAEALKQGGIAEFQRAEARRQRRIADARRAEAEQLLGVAHKLLRTQSAYHLADVSRLRPAGDPLGSMVAVAAYSLSPDPFTSGPVLTHLLAFSGLRRAQAPFWRLAAFAGDGRLLVLATAEVGEPPGTGDLVVFNATDLSAKSYTPRVAARYLCGFRDAKRAAVSDGKAVSLFDISGRGSASLLGRRMIGDIVALGCRPGSTEVLLGTASGQLLMVDVPTARMTHLGHLERAPSGFSFSRAGDIVAVVSGRGTEVRVIRIADQQTLGVFSLPEDALCGEFPCSSGVRFSDDTSYIALCASNGLVTAPLSDTNQRKLYPGPPCAENGLHRVTLGDYSDPKAFPPALLFPGETYYYDKEGFKKFYDYRLTFVPPYPVLDEQLAMFVDETDQGIATRSFADINAPMLGRQEGPQWVGDYVLGDKSFILAGATQLHSYDLDHYRTQLSTTGDVSYRERLRDSGDGVHAASFNFVNGQLRVLDISGMSKGTAARSIFQRMLPPVTTTDGPDGQHIYDDSPQVAYDPDRQLVTFVSRAGLRQFYLNGRELPNASQRVDALVRKLRVPRFDPTSFELSPRGRYIVFNNEYLITTAGRRLAEVSGLTSFSSKERYVFTELKGEGHVHAYELPAMELVPGVELPDSSPVALSPNERVLAYVNDDKQVQLYDFRTRSLLGSPLPKPPLFGRAGDLAFSSNGRHLIFRYDPSTGGHEVAIYSADPRDWQRSLCLAIGHKLTASEVLAAVGALSDMDPCRPFAAEMLDAKYLARRVPRH